jgi:hypothetical protein
MHGCGRMGTSLVRAELTRLRVAVFVLACGDEE